MCRFFILWGLGVLAVLGTVSYPALWGVLSTLSFPASVHPSAPSPSHHPPCLSAPHLVLWPLEPASSVLGLPSVDVTLDRGEELTTELLNSLTAFIFLFSGSSAGLCHVTVPKLRAPFGHLCPLSHNLKTAWWPFLQWFLPGNLDFIEEVLSWHSSAPVSPYSSDTLNKQRHHTHDVTNTQSNKLH